MKDDRKLASGLTFLVGISPELITNFQTGLTTDPEYFKKLVIMWRVTVTQISLKKMIYLVNLSM